MNIVPRTLEFGVFDHLDRPPSGLDGFYDRRLTLIEAYDRAGFYSYHLAEHHGTPLGMAPSPSVFLSAVAQRTRHLRMGPMVYLLPLYHPLRLAEEIAMLDRLSNGRLDVGIGRGRSPIELGFYGCEVAQSQDLFEETLRVLQAYFAGERLTFSGNAYSFSDVPIEVTAVQKPHPPFWYGVGTVDSAARCARDGINAITLAKTALAAEVATGFLSAASEAGHPNLKFGTSRFVVIADTDDEGLDIARRAYALWERSFQHLFEKYGIAPALPGERSRGFDGMIAGGLGFAGSHATVTAAIQAELEQTHANYFVGHFAFGDVSLEEGLRSVNLFRDHVMPALRDHAGAVA
jgi:alkanesulfonate monooxygenase SsuD/methylene tetrahydromethanopterin reductase-like flavin-dependent oxidoreductase (luciferase family)